MKKTSSKEKENWGREGGAGGWKRKGAREIKDARVLGM